LLSNTVDVFDGFLISEMIFMFPDQESCYGMSNLYDPTLKDNTFRLKLSFAALANCAVD